MPGDGEDYDFLAPAQMPDELGRLGPYRVLRVLGAGGMGVVFEAEDPQLKRHVALKAMKPGIAGSSSARKRFVREAQTAASVEHDHIVPVYQVGEDRGVPFIAMPLLRGETLADRLEKSKRRTEFIPFGMPNGINSVLQSSTSEAVEALPTPEVVRIGREIALGLSAAHRRGLIHRDIKPSNIWLEEETGRAKILDFGLARANDGGEQLTQAGAMIGTPAYMSPEQASGDEADARSDLFSLGCVLYHIATGRRPFLGRDALTTLVAVTTVEPPAPRELNPALPSDLNNLIVSLLSKDPAKRPQTARDVADRLASVGTALCGVPSAADAALLPLPSGEGWGEGALNPAPAMVGHAHPTKPPRRRGLVVIGIAAAAAALMAGVVIVIKDREGRVVAEVETGGSATVKTSAGVTAEIRASEPARDTNSVGNGLRAVPSADSAVAPIPQVGDAVAEGNRLAPPSSSAGTTLSLPALSEMSLVTEPTPIAGLTSWTLETIDHRGDIYKMEFNPDGTLLATYGEDGAVRLWNAEAGTLARIFIGADSPSGGIAWSPDGGELAVAASAKIKVWQVATGKRLRTIALVDGEAASLAWSPDGKTFAVGQRPIDQPEAKAHQLCLYDAASGQLIAERHRDGWSVEQIAWSPDSKRMLVTGDMSPVWLSESDDLAFRAMPDGFPWNASLPWTADGVPLAAGFVTVDGRLVSQLWRADPPEMLRAFATKFEGEQVGWLALSSDGRFVAAGCKDTIDGYPSERAAYVYEAAAGKAVAHFDHSAWHPAPWIFPKEEAPVRLWEFEPRYAISRDGNHLARCVQHLGGPMLFNVTTGAPVGSRPAITDNTPGPAVNKFRASWSNDAGSLAWRGEDGAVHFWTKEATSVQIAAPVPPWCFPGLHPMCTTDLAWSHDDRFLLASFEQFGRIDRYSGTTGELVSRRGTGNDSPKRPWAPAFSKDGRRFAGRLVGNARVGVFGLETSEPRTVLDAITDDIVTWSPDGRQISTRHSDATEIWDIESNECVRRFDGGKASLVWSPDGARFVLSGSGEATIHDAKSGNVLLSLDEPPGGAATIWPRLAWSPDGRHLAGRGRIWDAETGEVVARLPGAALAGEIGAPAWSPDGATLAYLGPGRAVLVADIAPKVRHSTAQGETLGSVKTQNMVALKGRHPDDSKRVAGAVNIVERAESRPVGADNSNGALPRVPLRCTLGYGI